MKTATFQIRVLGETKSAKALESNAIAVNKLSDAVDKINQKDFKLLDREDIKSFNDLVKALDAVQKASTNVADKTQLKKLRDQSRELKEELKSLQAQLKTVQDSQLKTDAVEKFNQSFDKTNQKVDSVVSGLKNMSPILERLNSDDAQKLLKSISTIEVRLKDISKQKIKIQADTSLVPDAKVELITKLKVEEEALKATQIQLNKEAKEMSKIFDQQSKSVPSDSIIGLERELRDLKKEYLSLGAAERESAQGEALKKHINDVRNVVVVARESLGDFRLNVGNYRDAIAGLIPTLKELNSRGIISQENLISAFKQENAARVKQLQVEIDELSLKFLKLGNAEKDAAERSQLLSQIENRTRELSAAAQNLEKTSHGFDTFKGKLLSVTDIISGGLIGGGIVGLASVLTSTFSDSVKEFSDAEKGIAKIRQQLIATGFASGKTAEGLKESAKQLSILTGLDDDQILNEITSGLLKFKRVSGEVFDAAQKSAIDLGSVLDGGFSAATQLIGKALDNPIKGITLLNKQGIFLDETVQKQIKSAIQVNDLTRAQNILLTELGSRFGDVGAAIQNSALKESRAFEVSLQNTKERIGEFIVGIKSGFLRALNDISDGVNIFSSNTIEFERGITSFNNNAVKELTTIQTLFNVLKSDTAARESRNNAIQELINKYPGLLSQMDLEYASAARLDEIQRTLTATVIKETGERIKQQTKAAILERAINKQLERDRIEAGIRTEIQNTDNPRIKGNLERNLKAETEFIDRQIQELKRQADEADKTISAATANLLKGFGAEVSSKAEEVKSKLTGLVTESFDVLSDDKSTKKAKTAAQKIQAELGTVFDDLVNKGQTLSETEFSKLLDRLNFLEKSFAEARRNVIGLADDANDEDATNNKLKEQLKRINDLDKLIAEKKADLVNNQFDKQVADATAKANAEIAALQLQAQQLKTKPVSAKDNEELKKIEEATKLISDALERQKQIIEKERQAAIRKFNDELNDARTELAQIISSFSVQDVEQKLNVQLFDQNFLLNQLKQVYEKDKLNLEKSLTNKQITKKEFDKQNLELDLKFASDEENIIKSSNENIKNIYKELFDSRKIQINELARLQSAQKQVQTISKVQEVQFDPLLSEQQKADKILLINERLDADLRNIETERLNSLDKNRQEYVDNIQSLADKEIDIEKQKQEAITNISSEAEEDRKKLREVAKEQALQLLQSISDTLFEINSNNSERAFEQQRQEIEREYADRLLLVKGNAAEEEKINREKNERIKKLEKEQSERRRKEAIFQAIINGAIAAIRALVDPGGLAGVALAVFVGIQTLLQIQKIKSASYAKGVYLNEKGRGQATTGKSKHAPDESGYKPVGTAVLHEDELIWSQKGTRKHSWLARLIDDDQKRLHIGAGSTLDANILKHYENTKAVIRQPIIVKSNNRNYPIPIVLPMKHDSFDYKFNMSDEQMRIFAQITAQEIAKQTGAAIYKGTFDGNVAASVESIREQRRREREMH